MAQKSVATLKDSVAGLLQGTNLNNVTALDKTIERAARVMAQHVDAPESSGRTNYMLYDGVFDYPAPDTIFGGALNDLRPQGVSRNPQDVVYKQPIELFDRTKHLLPNGYQVTFEHDKGTPIMRVAQNKARASIVIDSMDTADWTAGGTASTPVEDETVYYEVPASLRFTLTGAGNGYIEKTLTNSIDLTDYQGVGVQFLAIRTPSVTNLTSIELRLGSSNANYYAVTETDGFLGAWQVDDFLLVAFDLAGATTTGTPDIENIDYIRVTFAHTATITNMRAGSLFIALPSPHELLFQSAAIFNEDGTLSNTIADDDTLIILRDAAYTLFENFVALEIAQSQGGTKASNVVDRFIDKLFNKDRGLVMMYRADNPSEEIRTVGNYYD